MTDRLTNLEVQELQGQAADPPVSASGTARIYFNTTTNVRRISVNGGAYQDIGSGGGGPAQPLDTTFGPTALWRLNDTLADSSGNGLNLEIFAGDEKYTDILPGLRGFVFDGSTSLWRSAATPSLVLLGNMTIEVLGLFSNPIAVAAQVLLQHGVAASETEADNIVYSMALRQDIGWQYLAEEGAGTNIIYNLLTHGQPLVLPMLLGLVRSAGQIQFYLQGKPIGAPSAGLAAPTGGGNGRIYVGSDSGGVTPVPANTVLSNVKITPSALSAANMLAEYNLCLGPVFGTLT